MITNIKFFLQYLLKFNFLFKHYKSVIKKYDSLDQKSLDKIKLKKLKKLIKKAQKSDFYSDLYKDVNLENIKTLEDINILPIITKEMIKGKEERLLTVNKSFLFKGYTSGSTGSPLKVFYDYISVLKENAYIWNYREKCGLKLKKPIISLRGNLTKNDLFKYDRFTNTLHLSSYNLNEENINFYYEKIVEFKPEAILGYPSSIYLLVQLLKKCRKKLLIPLAFTSSETLYENQKDFIESSLNCKIFDWYGNAERTIALQKENYIYTEPSLYSINEYHHNHIISTNLINTSFPLIRYEVNDSLERKDNSITAILGRIDDFIILEDGTKIGRIDHIFKGLCGIKFAQIVQNEINKININLVLDDILLFKEEELIKKINQRLGNDIYYKINSIREDEIIYMNSGKFKMVVNNVK